MTRPLPRWFRHRCAHTFGEVRTSAGTVVRRTRCVDCGALPLAGSTLPTTTPTQHRSSR